MLIIADTERPVGVAGIMGGFDSEVTYENHYRFARSCCIHNGPSDAVKLRKALSMRPESIWSFLNLRKP